MLRELGENHNSMRKDTGTMEKNQWEMKNTVSDIKNTLEGMKSRLDKAEDQITSLDWCFSLTSMFLSLSLRLSPESINISLGED